MGKGGKKQKVPWYYMTIHYGVCHGPIDAINQIKIKEKPIFCTNMVEPSNLYVNWPELFGGETKEGGVEGVIECYFGGPDQLSSNDITNRKGQTATTHPGYRGIAHAFFRGYTDNERQWRPGNDSALPGIGWIGSTLISLLISRFSNQSPGGGAIAVAHADLPETPVGDIFDPANPRPSGGGFHWITNNPYLPSAWFHVTRIGQPIEGVPAKVYHAPYGGEIGTQSGTFPHNPQSNPGIGLPSTNIDLTLLADQVDAGNVVVTVRNTVRCEYHADFPIIGKFEGDPGGVVVAIWSYAYDENGNQTSPVYSDGSPAASFSGEGTVTVSYTRTVAPGVRTLRINGTSAETASSLTSTYAIEQTYELAHIALGPPLCEGNGTIGSPPDMNPAQIITECLTNRMWGMGAPITGLDTASFTYAGELLYTEGFGLSMLWQGQTTIEKFVGEVLDHIQGMLYISPKTGLWKLKLIRDDYDVADLRTLNPNNCTAKNRQRKAEGEIINEIIISYTDPVTEEAKTMTFHDIGRIAQLGEIVSDTRNYYGCRNEGLANLLGARDIRSASYPLFSADIEADRTFRDIEPGDVLLLDWPEDGIVGMPVRVGKVNYGRTGDSKVKFSVTEDIFGLEQTTYAVETRSQWQSPDTPPEDMPYQRAIEAPLPLMLRSGFTLDELSDDDYPEVVTALLGDDPTQDIEYVELWADELQPNGDTIQKTIAYLETTNSALLADALVPAASSTFTGLWVRGIARPETPEVGRFIYLDGPNESGEWVMLDAYDQDTDVWTVARGMFDTIPRSWASGALAWYVGSSMANLDPSANSAGTPTTFKLLPKVSFGTLQPDAATEIAHTPSERPYLPHRPANVQVGGNGFNAAVYEEDAPGGIPALVPVTWANRNRLLEDGTAPRWNDATVTPEVGQTTTVEVWSLDTNSVVVSAPGLTGTSYDIDTSTLTDYRFYEVRVYSVRDGFESLMTVTRGLEIVRLGYGNNYGYDYGQNDGE